MNTAIIYDTPNFRVISHGNGLAYSFDRKPDGLSIFFQGDDALAFAAELLNYEHAQPDCPSDTILHHLWADYGILAE